MRYRILALIGMFSLTLWCAPAQAGTAVIDFDSGVGPLNVKLGGTGVLTTAGGRASFTGSNITVLGSGGSPIANSGSSSATITLQPSGDAGSGVGLIMIDANDTYNQVTAICSSDGMVTLTDWIGNYRTEQFTYPAAGNNYMTLEYNKVAERATLTLNGSDSVFLEAALNGATSVYIGVASNGTGGFANFTGIGNSVPDYPPVDPDTDGDGVTDSEEIAAGTDPNDPGSVPVSNVVGASVVALDGTTVDIPAGCLPASSVNIEIEEPEPIPTGIIPDGMLPSLQAVDLNPDDTTFSAAVSVAMPYSSGDIPGIDEATLEVAYYAGPDYAQDGITNLAVDTEAKTVSFDTTHFTVFLIVGDAIIVDTDQDGTPDDEDAFPFNPFGATDSDSDGIGDEWEEDWFEDLGTATAVSNYDGDELTDREEFEAAILGANPLVAGAAVPAAETAALAALGLALLAAGVRRTKR